MISHKQEHTEEVAVGDIRKLMIRWFRLEPNVGMLNPAYIRVNVVPDPAAKVTVICWETLQPYQRAARGAEFDNGVPVKHMSELDNRLKVLIPELAAELQRYLTEQGAHVDFGSNFPFSGQVLVPYQDVGMLDE